MDNQHISENRLTSRNTIARISDLHVGFATEDGFVQALKGVSYNIKAGEMVALVGESGSGKSVSARSLMGLLPKSARLGKESRVTYRDIDITASSERQLLKLRGNQISMIFQEPMTSLNPLYTLGEQISEAILIHQKVSKTEARQKALALFEAVQLPHPEERYDQYPHQLSGGQRQRVMIAMALTNNPDLLIADEPTTALDVTVQANILRLIKELQLQKGMSVLLITHDLTIVRQFADYIYVMKHGEVVEHGTTEHIFTAAEYPYTQMLIDSEPKGLAKAIPEKSPVVLQADKMRVEFELGKKSFFGRQPPKRLVAVDDISVVLRKGETLGIVGESGSGKTTLAMAIFKLLSDGQVSGEITYDGQHLNHISDKQLRQLRKEIQVVFQDPFSSLNPRLSVKQILEEGLTVNQLCMEPSERRIRLEKALLDAGLPANILNRYPHEFSGGQRQRIAIARALILEPKVILLDEPTSALDLTIQNQIVQLLKQLQEKRGISYLFISHDLRVVKSLCHRVLVMRHGEAIEEGPTLDILENSTVQYTQKLIKAAFEVAA
ncbi:ABC transporter ATP-binding protein [Vibrio mangrovi]|uniref:ABC-type dipeptide transporter n=1 Tax=Vibrio mangrovi TaxID=474394 RepID=A0A1Y6ISZ0_9VIBR|nr:ABC transporter ATP-binding protein [Vibrio mangrovi]MDW6004479.1 ABC transporter ATP-binding protein [Vibrio mangrovi]SMS00767.1 Glutathione import ATP-binding protein GsiA [Vibrio mangrovi]